MDKNWYWNLLKLDLTLIANLFAIIIAIYISSLRRSIKKWLQAGLMLMETKFLAVFKLFQVIDFMKNYNDGKEFQI